MPKKHHMFGGSSPRTPSKKKKRTNNKEVKSYTTPGFLSQQESPIEEKVEIDVDGDGYEARSISHQLTTQQLTTHHIPHIHSVPDFVGVDTTGDGKIDTVKRLQGSAIRTLLNEVKEKRMLFDLAENHYHNKEQLISLPIIFLGATSGLLAFIGSSSLVTDEYTQNLLGVIIGCISTVCTILAGIQKNVQYGLKASMYLRAAKSFRTLESQVKFQMRLTEISARNPKDGWWDRIQEDILDIQKALGYYPDPDMIMRWRTAGLLHNDEAEHFDNIQDSVVKKLEAVGVLEPKDLSFLDEDTLSKLDVSDVTKRKLRTQRMLVSAKLTALAKKGTSKLLKRSADRILQLSNRDNGNMMNSSSARNLQVVSNVVSALASPFSKTKRKIYPVDTSSNVVVSSSSSSSSGGGGGNASNNKNSSTP
jgi:hypothetical protein